MPPGLQRFYGAGHLHFITCSCYRRQPLLDTAASRDQFLTILEEVRKRYSFLVVGYVVMPEHFHILIGEPERGNPSVVMQVLKQCVARRLLSKHHDISKQVDLSDLARENDHWWQRRFYDFNVWSQHKRLEKLRYMHHNPVKRCLVSASDLWAWSSFRFYTYDEPGMVTVNAVQQ